MTRRRFAARLAQLAFASWIAARHAGAMAAAAAASPGPAQALRVAALAERVLKLQAQAGQNLLALRARRSFAAALRELDAAIRALGNPPAASELHERTAILVLLVAQYRARAQRRPTREAALELGERAEEIEWEALRIAALLPAPADSPRALAAKAVDGGLRAERIGRLLLWQRWGIAAPSAGERLAAEKVALQADLDALRAASGSSAQAHAELQVAENQAAFLFAAAWRLDGADAAQSLEFAVKASDNARESLERLAAIYGAMGP
ncbi:MAG TPA: hypothetical protein VLS49_17340 [Usitatibacter sp.]|nr:hypothetical protein [Usitatibacter sp.]